MILTGRDIQWYISTGKLTIQPASSEQFQQNGVDLILDAIDMRDRGDPRFKLGCTAEILTLPDDLMAFVELRSTWARQGFFLPPTIVDAGFSGQLTLELLNFGRNAFPVGERFVHLIFARLSGPTEPYRGKYQNQSGITGAR
jgi:dCTP deaminase